eukprot:1359574-Rhodomonas_salina.1
MKAVPSCCLPLLQSTDVFHKNLEGLRARKSPAIRDCSVIQHVSQPSQIVIFCGSCREVVYTKALLAVIYNVHVSVQTQRKSNGLLSVAVAAPGVFRI